MTAPGRRPVVVVAPGEGDRVGNVELLARTVDTPFFNLGVVTLAPGQGVPGHVHEGEDDSWLVLDGTLTVTVGDDREVLRAGAGTFVLVPEGTYHALDNEGPGEVRFLNVHAPGGFDRRIGWRPRRAAGGVATLTALTVTVAVLLGLAGGPASAASLTRAKVQRIAAAVVLQQAPALSVAQATTARDAQRLAGRPAAAYLDSVAWAEGDGSVYEFQSPVELTRPVRMTVPDGVTHVHLTASTTVLSAGTGTVALYVAQDVVCHTSRPTTVYAVNGTGPQREQVVLDRVVPVEPGPADFVLCAVATTPTQPINQLLTVETVAVGPGR